jgi:hypothetical protein
LPPNTSDKTTLVTSLYDRFIPPSVIYDNSAELYMWHKFAWKPTPAKVLQM